ncbi:MAG: amino acid permease [Actinomycetota bacterium]|nr:amino acid permease [Actinomycetota bacterium]
MNDSAAENGAALNRDEEGTKVDGAARFSGAKGQGGRPEAMALLGSYDLPETRSYRLKNAVLGKPLVNEQMKGERLGKPTAMAVLSSDVISSSAYATEEILTILIPYIGLAAFSLILPISVLILVILASVAASYFQVVKAYPKAGGAYIVARDNFGPRIAQIAAVAIMIDYTVTVAISVAAGVDAVTSAVPALAPYNLYLSLFFVLLLAYGNLRGVREAGRIFAVPAYFFMANMAVLLGLGVYKALTHHLTFLNAHAQGSLPLGQHGASGLLMGATLFIFLQAFANGGTAVTGIEAVSTGVSVFRAPQWRNARVVLVAMAIVLGVLFFGLSFLSTYIHPIPRLTGTPTVISMIAQSVYGTGTFGRVLYYLLQIATYLILIFAANTSFNGFPFLVSYAAEDSFLPRQLARRGHRLALSNGIILLTVFSELILIGTRARVASLVAMYAIGVYTGFAMASTGMLKHHLRTREPGYKRAFVVNAVAAVLSTIVVAVFLVTKFTEGAWVVLAVGIPLVFIFIRLNRRYAAEEAELEQGVATACEAPVLRKHKVILFVENLDLATARAIQYARTLTPDEIRAVHIEVDAKQARVLEQEWARLGVRHLDLEVVECADRRIRRAALDVVAEAVLSGDSEVTVLLPRRIYPGFVQRILHDRTADSMAKVLSQLPHVNATIIPFEVAIGGTDKVTFEGRPKPSGEKEQALPAHEAEAFGSRLLEGAVPIGSVTYRRRTKVAGRVRSVRVQPMDSVPSLAVRLEDGTGGILLVFAGKRQVPGIEPGRRMTAEGTVGEIEGHIAIMNPTYEFAPVEDED